MDERHLHHLLPVTTSGWLAIWILVQPWYGWPHLYPDVSHRLTLEVCALGLWVGRLGQVNLQRLPRFWLAWWWSLAVVFIWHFRDPFLSGDYFRYFVETAVFSDGLATAVILLAGLWALIQLPVQWFRRIRWLLIVSLGVNLIVATGQWVGQPWWIQEGAPKQVVGLLGVDRFLATYALLGLPICWVWWKPLVVVPLALMLCAGKPLPWIALGVMAWPLLRWRSRMSLACLMGIGLWWMAPTEVWVKCGQRLLTWWHGWQASLAHPLAGWGFAPLTLTTIRDRYGYLLPNLHSDPLALAIGAGWLVTIAAIGLWIAMVRRVPRTKWAAACRASMLGLGAVSCVQSTLGHARIASMALLALAWWLVEQRQEITEC